MTDGIRQKTIVVRDSTAVKRKPKASKAVVGSAGSAGAKKADGQQKKVVPKCPPPVRCWPFFPAKRARRRRKPRCLVVKQGLKTLQKRTDACTELRRSAGTMQSMPENYLANVLDRIRCRIREREQQQLLDTT